MTVKQTRNLFSTAINYCSLNIAIERRNAYSS